MKTLNISTEISNLFTCNKVDNFENQFVSFFFENGLHLIVTVETEFLNIYNDTLTKVASKFTLIDKNSKILINSEYNTIQDIITNISNFMKTEINPFPYRKGETFSTKEYALLNNITTKKAYTILNQFESKDIICKYGYQTKNGWEDIDYSNLKTNSLHWQVCN